MIWKYAIVSMFIILILDALWLNLNKSMYTGMIFKIQGKAMTLNPIAVVAAYLLMFLSLFWIIYPNITRDRDTNINNATLALKHGAVFGLIAYGIYNATNLAILQDYQWTVAIKDTLWGSFVYFISVYFTLMLLKK